MVRVVEAILVIFNLFFLLFRLLLMLLLLMLLLLMMTMLAEPYSCAVILAANCCNATVIELHP